MPPTTTSTPAWLKESQGVPSSSSSKPAAKSKTNKTASIEQWQALGVMDPLAKQLSLRGFKAPTPIQRSTIPLSLATPPRDVLGMARTGSGKTLAYVIPLLQRLGGVHRDTQGPRAIIMCPTRELALQIFKVGKDMARGLKQSKEEQGPLRWAIIIGGTSLDTQFESMSSSPDIVIATPGRFLHLLVEMSLDLRSSELIIYDEADRLFEMGFESQLHEITHRLPPTRQSLLFSATLPTTVAEFAQASLNNPALIRLDADFNLSPDLTLSFYLVKPTDKDAVLMIALQSLLRSDIASDKRRQGQAIVFCATKHHVEYLTTLISGAGYTTSSVFGSLDQIARQQQLHRFRDGESQVLVVTDVAARGLDIPVMDNVINYDYPPNARLFIHRVGRTARAGQKGRAVSLVVKDDVPYLCDLEDVVGLSITDPSSHLLGSVPRALVDDTRQSLRGMEQDDGQSMAALREVMRKGQGMYERSRTKASGRAYRKAKDVIQISMGDSPEHMHPDFKSYSVVGHSDLVSSLERFRPAETVMEMGNKGKSIVSLMSERRKVMERKRKAPPPVGDQTTVELPESTASISGHLVKDFRDPSFFLQHERSHHDRDKGYSLSQDKSFAEGIHASTLNLAADEGRAHGAQKASQLRWDRKKKRFTSGDQVGADNKKMIRSESGALLPASYNSGRYREWKQKGRQTAPIRPNGPNTQGGNDRQGGNTSGILPAQAIYRARRDHDTRLAKNARQRKK